MANDAAHGRLELVREYLLNHPGSSRAEVMRALGVSARLVGRAEVQLDDEIYSKRRRRQTRQRSIAAALGLASIAVLAIVARREGPERRIAVQTLEQAHAERALYGALDRRDPGFVARAEEQLRSQDEALRLAALRYLTTMGVANTGALLDLLEDTSPRVRLAALQALATGRTGAPLGVQERALLVASDSSRPLAERLLALAVIEQGIVRETSLSLAANLIPLTSDRDAAVRNHVERLLESLLGASPPRGPDRGPIGGRAAAWRELICQRT